MYGDYDEWLHKGDEQHDKGSSTVKVMTRNLVVMLIDLAMMTNYLKIKNLDLLVVVKWMDNLTMTIQQWWQTNQHWQAVFIDP